LAGAGVKIYIKGIRLWLHEYNNCKFFYS
jgi:hypothetical protein